MQFLCQALGEASADGTRIVAAVASLDDGGMRVPDNGRSPAPDQIDVPIPVHVEQVGAFGAIDEHGCAADRPKRPHRAVDPCDEDAARALLRLDRAVTSQFTARSRRDIPLDIHIADAWILARQAWSGNSGAYLRVGAGDVSVGASVEGSAREAIKESVMVRPRICSGVAGRSSGPSTSSATENR